jgi:hypothetical protein
MMKKRDDGRDERWMERLDAIVEGQSQPGPEDDELLQMAGRLMEALAPLSHLDESAQVRRQVLETRLRRRLLRATPSARCRLQPVLATLVVLLFLVIGPGLLFLLNPIALIPAIHLPGAPPDSADQSAGLSSAAGPSVQELDFSQYPFIDLSGARNSLLLSGGRALLLFQATWLVDGHEVYLSWRSDPAPVPETAVPRGLRLVRLGNIGVLIDHNVAGQNIIEWYQRGFTYRLISDLKVPRLLMLALRCSSDLAHRVQGQCMLSE